MNLIKILFSFAVISLIFKPSFSQNIFSITDGMVQTCNGILYDTGGQGGLGYSNNENHTLTICPDNPTDIITLVFNNFNLSNVNTAGGGGNNMDYIAIYDGNSSAATSLGSYTTNQLQGTIVTCTSLNTSGCITLTFVSNSSGTGVFAATITCSTPCQRPTAVATSNPGSPARICKGDVVTFDGSASTAQAGFNIATYIWNYDDGTTDTLTTPTTSHTFNTEGEYIVQLYVIDNNGCINNNLVDIQLLVAPDPIFTPLVATQTICLGETGTFSATPDDYEQTWSGFPDGNLGGPQYVPDQVGQCFSTNLVFQQFDPGQQLTNINDFLGVCVDFEHSFMGDLVISLYCPSGQSVILHQQGGGGTNLGDPNQADDPNLSGTGANYCWTPTATNGTWVDNASFGPTPNVYTNNTGSQSLNPGTYESLNPMTSLVGCDLNGTWSIEFCDLWGADDGFVFGWSLDFNPAIIPNITIFTPDIGANCDSSYWSGPNMSGISSNCNSMQVVPSSIGNFNYTYTVVDNHGCTNDTTVTLTVTPGPEANAGTDISACFGDLVTLDGSVNNTIPTPPCLFTLNMDDSFGDGWNGAALTLVVNGVPTTQTIATGSSGTYSFMMNQGSTLQLNYIGGSWESEVSYEIVDCNGNVIFAEGPNPPIGNNIFNTVYSNSPLYVYSWSPTTGLSNPNIANPTFTLASSGAYTLTVHEAGHPLCGSTDVVNVFVTCGTCQPALTTVTNNTCNGSNNGSVLVTPVGVDGPPFIIQLVNPTNQTILDFDNNVSTTTTFDNLAAGSYIIRSIDTTGCQVDVTINITQPPVVSLTTSNDTIVCIGGSAVVNALTAGGNGGPFTYTWSNAPITTSSQVVSPTAMTSITVQGSDALGCLSPSMTVDLNMYPPILSTPGANQIVCPGGSTVLSVTPNGGFGGTYFYNWTDANGITVGTSNPVVVTPTSAPMVYTVSITDNCETPATINTLTVNWHTLPVPTFTSDTNSGCFPVPITFTNTTDPALVGSCLWDFGNGLTSTICGASNTIYTTPGTYTVSLTVTNPEGCVGTTTTPNMITVHGYPTADFIWSPEVITVFSPEVIFENTSSSDVVSYEWIFHHTLGTDFVANPIFIFPDNQPDNFMVELIVTNQHGCIDTIFQYILMNGVYSFYLPNGFTPNGDGINDLFYPQGEGIDETKFEFYIFNSWGDQIFESTEINKAWDGTHLNEPAPLGVYVWKVVTKDIYTNEKRVYHGHVTLLR
jgi:gliding motility-associated-like protein